MEKEPPGGKQRNLNRFFGCLHLNMSHSVTKNEVTFKYWLNCGMRRIYYSFCLIAALPLRHQIKLADESEVSNWNVGFSISPLQTSDNPSYPCRAVHTLFARFHFLFLRKA